MNCLKSVYHIKKLSLNQILGQKDKNVLKHTLGWDWKILVLLSPFHQPYSQKNISLGANEMKNSGSIVPY